MTIRCNSRNWTALGLLLVFSAAGVLSSGALGLAAQPHGDPPYNLIQPSPTPVRATIRPSQDSHIYRFDSGDNCPDWTLKLDMSNRRMDRVPVFTFVLPSDLYSTELLTSASLTVKVAEFLPEDAVVDLWLTPISFTWKCQDSWQTFPGGPPDSPGEQIAPKRDYRPVRNGEITFILTEWLQRQPLSPGAEIAFALQGQAWSVVHAKIYADDNRYNPPQPGPLLILQYIPLTPTITATPSSTPSMTPSTTPSITPSATPSPTSSTTPSVTPSPTPSTTPSVTPSPTPSPTPSATPKVTPSATPSVTPSATSSPTATATNTPRYGLLYLPLLFRQPTPTPTATNTPTQTRTHTPTPTVTNTLTPSCRDLVCNGGFEDGLACWTEERDRWNEPIVTCTPETKKCKSGLCYARMGGRFDSAAALSQVLTLPHNVLSMTLAFDYYRRGTTTATFTVSLEALNGGDLWRIDPPVEEECHRYEHQMTDQELQRICTSGQQVRLRFQMVTGPVPSSAQTAPSVFLDNVWLYVCYRPDHGP